MTTSVFPVLETERLVLRQARQVDVPACFRMSQDDGDLIMMSLLRREWR